jgi:enoyl-CoA hydratase/carnithine racemase
MTDGVAIAIDRGVQTIRFERPAKKNAITAGMYEAISSALVSGDQAPGVSAHLFVGSHGVFTAGSDIGEFRQRASSGGSLSEPVVTFIRTLPQVRKPIVAAVEGLAVGIGTTMLFHCDLVYASPTAALMTPFLDLGLLPEAGSSLLAPLRMGHARAFELLVLGEPFTAERALAAGIVNAILPSEELERTARKAAERLAAKPPEALALSRRLLRGDPAAVLARIEEEVKLFAQRLSSAEAMEAFTAFLEKRPADFTKLRR